MASKNTQNVVDGDILIIEELSKHLRYSKEERKFMVRLAKKGIVAVETMLEEAISRVSGIDRSNEDGEDFADGSDAKKSIVTYHDINKNNSRQAIIGNLKNKKGDILSVIADPLSGEVFFFRIPAKEVKNRIRLNILFSPDGGPPKKFNTFEHGSSITWRIWNQYRCKNFKEMCLG